MTYFNFVKNSEQAKINPIMYKEYLVRYPAYAMPCILQMIECASQPDTKLHKKVHNTLTPLHIQFQLVFLFWTHSVFEQIDPYVDQHVPKHQ